MTVIPIQSLPLGFRFRPTDEELINHYLKRKINGRIRSEIEVIPEIDVCKCEPWDLPDRALIRSDDPEWFFFSPKDRKYPNGHRSNRATEAGYWKATGKDRTIRTKAPSSSTVIGMKKTLVFHRGRAPKGVRTIWIMHEYRATEPEFESGEQGGYVLYRLFKKPEESAPNYNGDEMERSGLSPTPTKSSPSDAQNEVDSSEEHETPMLPPLNQVSPISDGQEDITTSLSAFDKANNCFAIPKDGYNNHMTIEQEAEAGAVVDPLLDALGQINSNAIPNISSPMCPYSYHPFIGSTNQEPHMGLLQTNYNEPDPMNDLLNLILSNQDEFPSAQMLTNEAIHSRSSSEIDADVGLLQGVSHHDPGWFYMDTSSDYPEISSTGLYENTSLLPYDIMGPDVYSVDPESESLQGLFNSMDESNAHVNSFNDGTNLEETGINSMDESNAHVNSFYVGTDLEETGIKIRPRQAQNVAPDNMLAQQGFAKRRIRLQATIEQREPSVKKEDEEKGDTIEVFHTSMMKNMEYDDNDFKLDLSIASTPVTKIEGSSIHDDTTLNVEDSESNVRLRTKTIVETNSRDTMKKQTRYIKTSKPRISVCYFIMIAVMMMMMMLVFLFVETRRWKKS